MVRPTTHSSVAPLPCWPIYCVLAIASAAMDGAALVEVRQHLDLQEL